MQINIETIGSITRAAKNANACVQGITKRGIAGILEYVTNWNEFKQKFGGLVNGNNFPQMCKDALDAGARLWVSRTLHYSDIDDINSVVGTKATGNIPVTTEVLSKGSFSITGGTVGTVGTVVNNGVVITSAAVDFDTDEETTAANVAANITAHTSVPNYTAVAVGAVVEIEAVVGSGSTPNGFIILPVVAGDVTVGSIVNMANGVTADTKTIDLQAEEVGTGYNGTVITVSQSSSGVSGNIDISVLLSGAPKAKTVSNVTSTPSTAELAAINEQLKGVIISDITDGIPLGTGTLASGVFDENTITSTDVNGSSIAKNGWYSFDTVSDTLRIYNFDFADPDADIGLKNYVDGRGDMKAEIRTPLGLGVDGLNDYLDGTGAYSHTPIDSYSVGIWLSDVQVTDELNPAIKNKLISSLGKYAGVRATIDANEGAWISACGSGRNLQSINKIPLDLSVSGNKGQFDVLYEKGLNCVSGRFGATMWGNRTLLKDKTSLLSKANIADLSLYIKRTLSQIVGTYNFKPNDFILLKDIYRAVRPFIMSLVTDRAIYGSANVGNGEGEYWFWNGDQEANELSQLVVNDPDDFAVGIAVMEFVFLPIGANEYITVIVSPTNPSVILTA